MCKSINNFYTTHLTGNYLGVIGSTMVGFDTGDCDTVAPNDDLIPRSLKPTGIQWVVAIVHWLVS